MPTRSPSPSRLKVLYTQNPFYAISAVLMLYAVRAGYGKLEIGEINCWIMLGVLVAYTLALALIGVPIVRWGKVWEDARSIVLLLLLLFFALILAFMISAHKARWLPHRLFPRWENGTPPDPLGVIGETPPPDEQSATAG